MLELQLDAYKFVVEYIDDLLNNETHTRKYIHRNKMGQSPDDDEWTMSVTGHSLGGGIATIVGATLRIPVIVCVFHPTCFRDILFCDHSGMKPSLLCMLPH